jgi:hypothetical protein
MSFVYKTFATPTTVKTIKQQYKTRTLRYSSVGEVTTLKRQDQKDHPKNNNSNNTRARTAEFGKNRY